MTHHDPHDPYGPLDPADELASAHVDGMTTREEAARIEADPNLQRRVAEMEAVQDAVWASSAPIDHDSRERAIAAALGVFDHEQARTAPDAAPSGAVAPLRRRTRPAPSRNVRWLGIAAAVALLAIAVPLLANLGGDDDSDEMASESAQTSGDESAASSQASGEDGAADEDATAYSDATEGLSDAAPETPADDSASIGPAGGEGSTARTGVSLGTFEDGAALHDHVRELLGDPSPAPGTSSADGGAQCASVADGGDDPASGVALTGWAVLAGQDVRVTVIKRGDGSRTMTVADPAQGCAELLVTELDP